MSRPGGRHLLSAPGELREATATSPAASEARRLAETGQDDLPLSREAATGPGSDDADGEAAGGAFDEAAHTYLLAACGLSGASAGAVMLRDAGADAAAACRAVAVHLDGQVPGEAASALRAFGAACAAQSVAVMGALAGRQSQCLREDEPTPAAAAAFAPQLRRGQRLVRHSALRHAGRSTGYLLLAFDEDRLPGAQTLETIDRLGRQLMIVRAHFGDPSRAVVAGAEKPSAHQGLAELVRANQALHNAVERLPRVNDLPAFLETVLGEALKATGTGNGAVVLVEREAGIDIAHHIVMLTSGVLSPRSVKRALQIDRTPFNHAVRCFAARVAESTDGVASTPEDRVYTDAFRGYLELHGVRSIHSMPLRVGGRMIGWFGVGYPDRAPRGAEQLMLLRLLADQMTIAVELTRMAEQAKQAAVAQAKAHDAQVRIDKLMKANQALTRAIDVLSSDTGVDTMLGHTLGLICEQLLDAQGVGALWMVDAADGRPRRHLVHRGSRMPADESIDLPSELLDALFLLHGHNASRTP